MLFRSWSSLPPLIPVLKRGGKNPLFNDERIVWAEKLLGGVMIRGDIVPEAYRQYYYSNPVVIIIESYRDILMHNVWPDGSALFIIGMISLVGIWLGTRLIARFEYIYPKIMV